MQEFYSFNLEEKIICKIQELAKNPELWNILKYGGCTGETCNAPWEADLAKLSLHGMINYLTSIRGRENETWLIEKLTQEAKYQLGELLALYLDKDAQRGLNIEIEK